MYVSDERQRSLPEFARPKGSPKMDDFFVAPSQCGLNHTFVIAPRNRLIFGLLNLMKVRILLS
jgi:hypothetical protein